MITFRGYTESQGAKVVEVWADNGIYSTRFSVRADWGANTDAAAETAKTLLRMALEHATRPAHIADSYMHQYKREVLAGLGDSWTLTGDNVLAWLDKTLFNYTIVTEMDPWTKKLIKEAQQQYKSAIDALAWPAPTQAKTHFYYFRQQPPDCQHCGEPRIAMSRIKLTLAVKQLTVAGCTSHIVAAALAHQHDNASRRLGRDFATDRLLKFLAVVCAAGTTEEKQAVVALSQQFIMAEEGPTKQPVRRRRSRGILVLNPIQFDLLLAQLREAEKRGHAYAGRAYERVFRGEIDTATAEEKR